MQLSLSFPRARVAATWILAMAWHLWRIATLRPAFSYLADDKKAVASFASVFLVAGLLRHWIFGPADFFGAFGNLALFSLLLLLLLERSHRSSSLIAAGMGVCTLFDLLIVALEQTGAAPGVGRIYALTYVELGALLALRHVFLKQPAAVQARGYKPHREAL